MTINKTRWPEVWLAIALSPLVALAGLRATDARAVTRTQNKAVTQVDPNFIKWEAEWFHRVESPGAYAWNTITPGFVPPAPAPQPLPNPSGGQSINSGAQGTTTPEGLSDNYVIYRLTFTSPGDYGFYAFRSNQIAAGGPNGDSMYPPPDFNANPHHNTIAPASANFNRWNTLPNNAWSNLVTFATADQFPAATYFASGLQGIYRVAAGQVGTPLEFRIESRDNGTEFDRLVLHKLTTLNAAALNPLALSTVTAGNQINVIPLSARTAGIDHDVVGMGTGLRATWYKRNSGNLLDTARTLIADNPPDATWIASQIDYPRGGASDAAANSDNLDPIANPLGRINAFIAPDMVTYRANAETIPTFDFDFGPNNGNTIWKFEGYIDIRPEHDLDAVAPGVQVKFIVPSDDATNLVLGGIEVINNDFGHALDGAGRGPVMVTFEQAGAYPISMLFTQGGGGYGVELLSNIATPVVPVHSAYGVGYDAVPTELLFAEAPARPDVDHDGNVNGVDFEIIRSNFLRTGMTPPQGDVNYDTVVDLKDFGIWKQYAFPAGGGPANVPEPATLSLLGLGTGVALVWLARRRRMQG